MLSLMGEPDEANIGILFYFNTLIGWALSGIGYLFINDFQFGSFNILSSLYSLGNFITKCGSSS